MILKINIKCKKQKVQKHKVADIPLLCNYSSSSIHNPNVSTYEIKL